MRDALQRCIDAARGDARFAPIARKLNLGAETPATPAMLRDASTPGPRERDALALWAEARSACVREEARRGNPAYRPPLEAYRLEAEGKVIEAAADLHRGAISFGEFNRRRQAIAAELAARTDALRQRIAAQRAAEQHADRDAREREQARQALAEAERDAARAEQEADRARQAAEQAARRRPRGPIRPAPPPLPRPAPFYRDCFRIGDRIACTYR